MHVATSMFPFRNFSRRARYSGHLDLMVYKTGNKWPKIVATNADFCVLKNYPYNVPHTAS